MKTFISKISLIATLLLSSVALLGCDKGVDDNETQRDYIISYLTTSHSPKLIAESELASSLDFEPAFYTPYGQYAFRYIADFYSSSRESEKQVDSGSKVTLTFSLYGFTSSGVSTTLPLYSNDATLESSYIAAGLNTALWDFEPLEITIGESNILSSIQDGLIGCRNGDYVEFYLTRNITYNGDITGLVSFDEAVLFICTIENVE
ncbi:MAG: hypothetical protein SNH79_02700 [Rikenellaceae bacterium]